MTKLTDEEYEEIRADFCKCSDVALKMNSLYPDEPRAFTGTVSEQLMRGFCKMQEDLKKKDETIRRLSRLLEQ